MIGAAAGSAWLTTSLTDSGHSRESVRLMQLSLSSSGDMDLTRLQNPVLGTTAYVNADLNAKAARLADGYLNSESHLHSHAKKTMRVSEDARAQKAHGAVLVQASFHNPNPPALRVSSAEPLVMRNASPSDLDCLTQALYYEARGEGTDGMRAVAQVILNRVRHPSFPSTICKVVYQGAYLRTGCQFSFACDGSLNRRTEAGAWRRARTIAEQALNGYVMPSVGSATHFHTTAVSPRWAPKMTRVTMVGTHVFYQFGGSKSRLNKSDAVQPSEGMPQIASAEAVKAPSALMTVLSRDEAADHAVAVPVSQTLTGPQAKELNKAIKPAKAEKAPAELPAKTAEAKPAEVAG